MKERRVTSQQVAKAGGLVPFISQLVDALRSGNMDQRKASAMSLKCLTEQASLHEVAEAAKKENSVLAVGPQTTRSSCSDGHRRHR